MNKKIILLAAALLIGGFSFAQKSKVREANRALNKASEALQKNDQETAATALQEAKAAIDLATADPATSENADAWFTKAGVYLYLQELPDVTGDPFKDGAAALQKAFSMDSKLKDDPQAVPLALKAGFFLFNDGIVAFNNSEYEASVSSMKQVASFLDPEGDKKKFILYPVVDTIRARAQMIRGYDQFYLKQYDKSIALLNEAKNSPYLTDNPDIYLILARAYEQKGDGAAQLAVLEEGKKKYPNDQNVSNAALNYYLSSGKQDEMISKLEEAVAKDPTNSELQFNLGIVYDRLAHPKEGAAPANAAEYEQKSEAAYKKALELNGERANYNFQLGAFYYNQAAVINQSMNDLGASAADQVKYNKFKAERDALFAQALPLLEKSRDLYDAGRAKLTQEERGLFVQALEALSKIYTIQNKLDKAKEAREMRATL